MLWQQLTSDQQAFMQNLTPGRGGTQLLDEICATPKAHFMEIYSGDPATARWWETRGGSFVKKTGDTETTAKQLCDLGVLTHVDAVSPEVIYVGLTCPKGVALLWDAQHLSSREPRGLTLLRGWKDPDLGR